MEKKEEMDLFRFGVIQPLLSESGETLKSRIRRISKENWLFPDGSVRKISPWTIENWYYRYRGQGLNGLQTRVREDKGRPRKLNADVCNYIEEFINTHSELKTSILLSELRKEKQFEGKIPSDSTIYRYIRKISGDIIPTGVKERKAFESPYSGCLWQTDCMYGPEIPYLNTKTGRWVKKRTYLIAIIDDHSRLLCHGEFFFSQDVLAYLACLKNALFKRGIPEKIYCDNGKIFLSKDIKRILAKLGSTVIHTQVRDCEAKGKIERFFLTVRCNFLSPLCELNPPGSLDDLNRQFAIWSEDNYNHKKHSAINTTPIERWLKTSHRIKTLRNLNDDIFMFETQRKVKKDGTISFNGRLYETSSALAGKFVNLRYDPFFTDILFVSYDEKSYGKATLLNKNFNSIR